MRAARVSVLVLLALAVAPGLAAGQGPAPVRSERLPNGLTVLVRENPLAPVVAVALFVRVGTRWEGAENAGISNFLHAVMVKGTARRSGA
ncbi:MAG: insulinase family protein, partial [Gallionellaceae bacterium]